MRTQHFAIALLIAVSSTLLLSTAYADGWRAASKAPNHTSVALRQICPQEEDESSLG